MYMETTETRKEQAASKKEFDAQVKKAFVDKMTTYITLSAPMWFNGTQYAIGKTFIATGNNSGGNTIVKPR